MVRAVSQSVGLDDSRCVCLTPACGLTETRHADVAPRRTARPANRLLQEGCV